MTVGFHLSDGESQALAAGEPVAAWIPGHAAGCRACRATTDDYRRVAEALQALDRPRPPPDFTLSVLSRLPPPPPPLGAGDFLAVILAASAAAATAALFLVAGGPALLLGLLGAIPAEALTEATLVALQQARDQIAVLLSLSAAALLIGAPLWRVLSHRRATA